MSNVPAASSALPVFAVIGASGFVGLRTVELLTARGDCTVRPVVRAASSLAVLARQRLDWRIADLLAPAPLAAALHGCSICIHAAIGDAGQIVRMAAATYEACAVAGVRRLVWLSSASVHGQDCPVGSDESAPLHERHPLVYNNAKVRAERRLTELARDRRVEVVMLRPGVVFGPRSRWLADVAADLAADRAAWIDDGRGVCNSIYIDNLVEAIRLAATVPAAAGETFLVGDTETVTWAEFLLPIAAHLGHDRAAFHPVPPPRIIPERENRLAALTTSPAYARLGSLVPARAKRLVKALAAAWPSPAPRRDSWTLRNPRSAPRLTAELALLQQCRWKLPHAKAERILGYRPPVAFRDGLARSLGWLDFAGIGATTSRS
ncbi:MAG TPA: NAD(P)H-binding protein [Opitutaceae bacterium]|nr:NAD(P)H-binding protein [Opitutaceae bacterium]